MEKSIAENMHRFWDEIYRHYEAELHHLADPIDKKEMIEETLNVFEKIQINDFSSRHGGNQTWTERPREFVANLMSSMSSLNLNLAALDSVQCQESNVLLAENLLERTVELRSYEWLPGSRPTVNVFENYRRWVTFLDQLEQTLGTYDVQKVCYSFPELRSELGSIEVTTDRVKILNASQTMPQQLRHIPRALTSFIATDDGAPVVELGQLNPIIEYFFAGCNSSSVSVDGSTVKIAGNFILASKVVSSGYIPTNMKTVVIDAWDTLFLDATIDARSINQNNTFDVVMIGSTIQSFGQSIQLSGSDAHTKGGQTAAAGMDGVDGEPGGKGGNFLGMFSHKEGDLAVVSNGGRGGNGQNGADGASGIDGDLVPESVLREIEMDHQFIPFWEHDSCAIQKCPRSYDCSVVSPFTCNYHRKDSFQGLLKISGMPGLPGENGRNGGNAGQGGRAGAGKLYEIGSSQAIEMEIKGNVGTSGLPGNGGQGGEGGTSRALTACLFGNKNLILEITFYIYACDVDPEVRPTFELSSASSGYNGRAGSLPPPPVPNRSNFDPYVYTPDLVEFKARARTQLRSGTASRRLLPLLMSLESNEVVNSEFFTPKLLVQDLVALEQQLPLLLNNSFAQPKYFYESLLNRTAKSLNKSHSEEERRILRHAASVAYGRLVSLSRPTSQSNVITDLEGYIDITAQVVGELAKEYFSASAAERIKTATGEFDGFIQSGIEKIDGLVTEIIQPELQKIHHQMDTAVDLILQQLIAARENASATGNELMAKKLEFTISSRKVLGLLSVVAVAAPLFGPVGEVLGAAAATGVAIYGVLAGDDESVPLSTATALENNALKWYNDRALQSLKNNEAQLRDLKEKVEEGKRAADTDSDVQETLQKAASTLERVDDLRDRIERAQSLDNPAETFESLQLVATSMKNQVKEQLEPLQKKLEQQKVDDEQSRAKRDKNLMRLQGVLATVNAGADLYHVYKDDKAKVAALAEAEQAIIQGFDAKINNIADGMPKILNRLQQLSEQAIKSARNPSSGASLDISSWQLQSTLKDISSQIEINILEGVPLANEVKACMGKLEDAFRTLFKVCDRIQDYVSQKRMANFVSQLLLSTVEAAPLRGDPELQSNLQKLILVSESNLVLNYWKNIESSFRMYVFPYADLYLTQVPNSVEDHDLLLLPKNLTDLPGLVSEISWRSTDLKRTLANFRTTIVPELHTNQNDGDFDLRHPFYSWNPDDVKPVLADLLAGHPVNLIADARSTQVNFDAIKFKSVRLQLIHGNASVNTTLQAALDSFDLNMTHNGVNNYRCSIRKCFHLFNDSSMVPCF